MESIWATKQISTGVYDNDPCQDVIHLFTHMILFLSGTVSNLPFGGRASFAAWACGVGFHVLS